MTYSKARAPLAMVTLRCLLALAALLGTSAAAAQGPVPWAMGDRVEFSGTLLGWDVADALGPSEAAIVADSFEVFPSVTIGTGSVAVDGTFTFALSGADVVDVIADPVEEAFCEGMGTVTLEVSEPALRVLAIDPEVPSHHEEGRRARPGGRIRIRTEGLSTGSLIDQYGFVYAAADGVVDGSCSEEGIRIAFHLDLRRGWNSVRLSSDGGLRMTTAAIPEGAGWYLVNPLTLAASQGR
jgi:hypothetical protein